MNQLNVNLPELPYAVSEAMNRLRINIKFCGKNTRKILLTSCQPNEGKSTISAYLWKMLAEAGFPTVLVDVDLRKSVMKTRFQMDYDDDTTMGLNHYLSGMAEYEDVVYSTNIPNGYMVPCTQLLENPSALLEDVRFKRASEYSFRELSFCYYRFPAAWQCSRWSAYRFSVRRRSSGCTRRYYTAYSDQAVSL